MVSVGFRVDGQILCRYSFGSHSAVPSKLKSCTSVMLMSSSPPSSLVEAGTPVIGNDELENNLVRVEKVAFSRGLSPDALSVMLEFAMSLRMGKPVTRY